MGESQGVGTGAAGFAGAACAAAGAAGFAADAAGDATAAGFGEVGGAAV